MARRPSPRPPFTSMQGRDGRLAAGMEGGMEEGHARLDEPLPQMKRAA
jgi:hypothetical protein